MVIAMEHTSIGIADRGEISQRGTQGPIKPRRGQGIISLGADMNRARIVQRPSSREALHLSLSNGIVRALSINPTRPSSSGAESERGRIATAMAGFCLALVVLTSWAMAAEQYQSMGAGTKSCAVFGRTYKDKPKTANMIYFSWAQGYMSGVNIAAGINNKDYRPANLNAMTIAAQQRFIRDFCDRNPLKDFREAVDTLLSNIRSTKSGQ